MRAVASGLLRLDEDLSPFYRLCLDDTDLRWVAHGAGRLMSAKRLLLLRCESNRAGRQFALDVVSARQQDALFVTVTELLPELTDAMIEEAGARREAVVVTFLEVERESYVSGGVLMADKEK